MLLTDDSIVVKRCICNSLPDITRRIAPLSLQRSFAISACLHFSQDDSVQIRQALLEILGPLIYIFAGSVPTELIDIFLGKMYEEESPEFRDDGKKAPTFLPLMPSIAATLGGGGDGVDSIVTTNNLWNPRWDNERAIITAYNLPGVVLSLGPEGWPRLRALHCQLAQNVNIPQPRYLIASSIHDIAKMVGSSSTATDLFPIFLSLTKDEDSEISLRAFERFTDFVQCLPKQSMLEASHLLLDTWSATPRKNWRLREILAESMSCLTSHLDTVEIQQPFLQLLQKVLQDEITAIRIWGAKVVPGLVQAAKDDKRLRDAYMEVIFKLPTSTHHKSRALYVCVELIS